MPIAINPNRPSSSNSNKLPNNGPPRPTATSRRGGRTRSRSPAVVMMGGAGGPGVGGTSARMVGSPTGEPPPGIGNPSSAAAAAAAAAAKAYATGAGPGRWGKPEGNHGPPPPPGGVMGDPYSHHGGPGGGGPPPPPYHGGSGAGGPPHGHPSHPNSGGPGHPPPPGHHPPPYGYDNRGGWPPEDAYASGRGRQPDGANPPNGGPPSSRPPYQYDPYARGPGGVGGSGPPPGRPPPPSSQTSGQSSMGPPAHPHDPEGRYGHHPPSSRGRYDHPGMGSRQQQPPPPPATPNSAYHRGYDSRHGPPPPTQHHSSQHPPSSHGPPQPPPQGMSSPHPPSQSPHHPMYSPQDYAGNRYNSSSSGRDRPPEHHHPSPHHHLHPSRHQSSNSSIQSESRRGPGGPPPQQPPSSQGASITRSSPNPTGSGGTTIVIGGSKPIHLPKPTSSPSHESPKVSSASSSLLTITPSSPLERPSARSSTSIFRDRPSDDKMSAHRNSASKHPPARGRSRSDSDSLDGKRKSKKETTLLGNEDSPHNILLSLRTPTTSFEENDKAKTDGDNNNRDEGSNKRSKRGSKKDDDDDNDTIQRKNSTNLNRQSPLNRSATDQLYETQRSNDFLKPNGSIDLAPSFNILNASFDSLTDGPYFTLDSTLGQTESFDFKRTDSLGGDQAQLLRRTSSVGNYSTQILATGSTPGIGYSPVNSFGTTAGGFRRASSTGASSLMLVGGAADSGLPLDAYGTGRDSSRHRHYRSDDIDTSMFRSYSGGAGPLDDSHLRMSVGSFGYSRSYAEPSSPGGGGGYYASSQDNLDPQPLDSRGERGPPPHHTQGPPPQPAPSQHPHPHYSSSSSRHHGYNHHHQPSHHSYEHPSQHYHRGAQTSSGGVSSSRIPSFYNLLRKYRAAFKGCTFLLPGLKSAVLELSFRDNDNNDESKKWDPLGHGYHQPRPSPLDNAIARRRVECSICAFGGNVTQEHSINAPSDKQSGGSRSSIFRDKDGKNLPTVTPSSTEASSKGRVEQSPGRVQYDEALAGRYYENESRLSWEFEEEPPIEVPEHTSEYPTEPYVDKLDDDDDDDDDRYEIDDSPTKDEDKDKATRDKATKSEPSDSPDGEKKEKEDKTERESKEDKNKSGEAEEFDGRSTSPTPSGKSRATNSSPQSKMKYRCKLCGQPKQNHRCPFQQSLARSIGVMVYPAVNAFTADEPGTIAAPLSEMNNFFDIVKQESQMAGDSSVGGASAEVTPDRGSLAGGPAGGSVHGPPPTNMVSPDSLRSSPNNPVRSSSSHQSSFRHVPTPNHPRSSSSIHSSSGGGGGKKRGHSEMNHSRGGPPPPPPPHRSDDNTTNQQGDLLFLDAMELKPEQFRVVSQSATKTLQSVDAFKYPALPLPYAQRKRLSDNLFSLSNDVAKLTDECAQVLREAREKDMWDLAVAELMTQVIIVLHCPYNDYQLEGLRQYLLTLGIAC